MITPEIKRFINLEIKRQVNIIMSGTAGATSQHTETINDLYPGMGEIPDRPIMQPYGFASRAKEGTVSVTARQGDHPGNVVTLGHRDKDKPADLDAGESSVYSSGKFEVRVLNGQIQVGKNGDFETVVVGDTLKTLLISLIDTIVQHTHLGNLGYPTGFPQNAAAFNILKANTLSNDKILAKDGGRY